MITNHDFIVSRYGEVLCDIISLAVYDHYSYSVIERKISYSSFINELERGNDTLINFTDPQKLYEAIFPDGVNKLENVITFHQTNWVSEMYIELFLKYQLTFEALFFYIPLKEMNGLYDIYHEMDFHQLSKYFEEKRQISLLHIISKNRGISLKDLAESSNLSNSMMNSLAANARDITKLSSESLFLIAKKLNIKMETLLQLHLYDK